jgi:hypothetical protein
LVGFEPKPTWLRGKYCVGAYSLFEKKCLVINEPIAEGSGLLWAKFLDDGFYIFKRVEEVELNALEAAFQTAEPVKGLHAKVLGEDNLPSKPSRRYFCSRKEILQSLSFLSELSPRFFIQAHIYAILYSF